MLASTLWSSAKSNEQTNERVYAVIVSIFTACMALGHRKIFQSGNMKPISRASRVQTYFLMFALIFNPKPRSVSFCRSFRVVDPFRFLAVVQSLGICIFNYGHTHNTGRLSCFARTFILTKHIQNQLVWLSSHLVLWKTDTISNIYTVHATLTSV